MTGRLHGMLFAAFCVVGAAASVGLTIHEASRTPSVVAHIADDTRVGTTTTVTVSVRNTTGVDRGAVVRVAARDRAGHDLETTTAARELSLPAHARRTVTARLTLTSKQQSEQLHGFYPSVHACESDG